MKSILKHTAALLLASAATSAAAQDLRSAYFMQTSVNRHQMNPALLDSAYVGVPLLNNINIGTTGNVGMADFVYKSNRPGYDLTTFMNPEISAGEFLGNLHDKNRLDVYINYNLFSFAFQAFKGMNSVELNLKSSTNVTLPYELFEFMKETGAHEQYSIDNLGIRTQNYLELALGHSHQITDRLKVGAKMKFLIGAAYADFNVEHMDVTMNGDQWSINADAKLATALGKSNFSYDDGNDPATIDPNRGGKVDGIDDYSFSLPGFGLAFDFGATYQVLDNLTVSASITDLGFISWKDVNMASSRGEYTFDGFTDIWVSGDDESNKIGDQFENLGDDLNRVFSIYDDGKGKKTQGLAATLNIGAEYTMPFYDKFRVGFLYTSRIHGRYSYHQGMLSAAVRPVKWFEANLNTSGSSTGWQLGGMLSFYVNKFNFYLASDRMIWGKFGKPFIPLNRANTNISLGFNIPM